MPCFFFPFPRPGLGSGAVFPGRSSADGGIEEFSEFRDTARSSLRQPLRQIRDLRRQLGVPRLQDLDQHALHLSQHGEIITSGGTAVTARHHPRSSRRAGTQAPQPQRKRDRNLHQPVVT